MILTACSKILFLLLFLFTSDPNWNIRNETYLEKIVPEKISRLTFLTSSYRLSYLDGAKWAYSFLSYEGLTPEEGRELVLKVQNDLVKEIQKNQEAIQYLNAKELDKEIAVKITFWTKDFDRLQPPHIAQIYYLNGKVYYNLADPEGNLLDEVGCAGSK